MDETSLSVRGGDSLDSCTCEDVKKCAWSKKMLLDIHRLNLPRNSPTRKKVVRFMKYRVCEGEIGKNSVYCCEGGSYPTRTQVKQLKDDQRIIEANRTSNRRVPLFFLADGYPLSVSDLLQNHMSTSHTIRATAQEV